MGQMVAVRCDPILLKLSYFHKCVLKALVLLSHTIHVFQTFSPGSCRHTQNCHLLAAPALGVKGLCTSVMEQTIPSQLSSHFPWIRRYQAASWFKEGEGVEILSSGFTERKQIKEGWGWKLVPFVISAGGEGMAVEHFSRRL